MRTIIGCILCLIVSFASSQTQRFQVGLLGGANVTTSDPGIGWNAAAIGFFNFHRSWAVQGQLGGLMERNTSNTYIFDGSTSRPYLTYSQDFRRSYLEFASIVCFHPRLNDKITALGGIGLSTRLLLKSKLSSTTTDANGSVGNSSIFDMTSWLFRWSYNVPLQAGMELKIGNQSLLWLFEYNLALRNLYKPVKPDGSFDYAVVHNDIRYNSIALKLAYLLPLRK